MKLRYPAEAFALGIVLFSAGMKEAFAAGILVIFTSVFAELLKNLLEKAVPTWSLKLCVYIASGSVCASAFLAGFAVLGTVLPTELWIMVFIVGLLCENMHFPEIQTVNMANSFWNPPLSGDCGSCLLFSANFWAAEASSEIPSLRQHSSPKPS